jgi:hypothetical protein
MFVSGILYTIPATLASAERSLSELKPIKTFLRSTMSIKTFLRSTMSQERPVNLCRLSIEQNITGTIDFDTVIRSFAEKRPVNKLIN